MEHPWLERIEGKSGLFQADRQQRRGILACTLK
jgi:hypothetical protein